MHEKTAPGDGRSAVVPAWLVAYEWGMLVAWKPSQAKPSRNWGILHVRLACLWRGDQSITGID